MSQPPTPTDPAQPVPPAEPPLSAYRVIEQENFKGQLYFFVRREWTGVVPLEQTNFVLEFDKTYAILRAAFRTPDDYDPYFDRLKKLAEFAFNGHTAMIDPARQGLMQFKDDIVQKHGRGSKSRHLKELAIAALIASILILVTSLVLRGILLYGNQNGWISTTQPSDSVGTNRSVLGSVAQWDQQFTVVHFGILLAATMWGIWLSFALRNMNITFDQLRNPEADLLGPWMRLGIYGALAFMLALFFQLRLVTIAVGPFSTAAISQDALIALTLGLILGFSDKVLPAEVRSKVEYIFAKSKMGG